MNTRLLNTALYIGLIVTFIIAYSFFFTYLSQNNIYNNSGLQTALDEFV